MHLRYLSVKDFHLERSIGSIWELQARWFGGFQALMPLVGYLLGSMFTDLITSVSHWIAFVLLLLIGGGMIREARSDAECVDASMDMKSMFLLAIATSIDALAVGVSFAFLKVAIVPAVCLIGIVTFVCSATGVKDRQSVWCAVSIESRVVRRCDLDFDRSENAGRGAREYLNIES